MINKNSQCDFLGLSIKTIEIVEKDWNIENIAQSFGRMAGARSHFWLLGSKILSHMQIAANAVTDFEI